MKKILTFLALCLLTIEVFGQVPASNPFWMKWKVYGDSLKTKGLVLKQGTNITLSRTADTVTITAAGGGGADTLVLWRINAAAYPALAKRLHLNDSTGITISSVGDTTVNIFATLGVDIAWGELQSAVQESMHVWAANLRNTATGADTVKFDFDTLEIASGLTGKVIIATSVAGDTLFLSRDGKTLTDSLQVVQGYIDIKILTGTTAPAATYMRIYPVGDSLWAKTSDNDSFNLTRAGAAGGGADTLTFWILGAGGYPASAHRIRFLQGDGATLSSTGDTSLTIATSLGTSIGTGEIEANAVDGTKIAIASQATGDLISYDGTDWVRVPAGASNTVLHGNGAAAPSFSAVVSADITDGTVTATDIADAGHLVYLIPEPANGIITRDLSTDSLKEDSASMYPLTWNDSLQLRYEEGQATGRVISYIIGWTLDSAWSAWADTALRIWYKTESATDDSLKIFVYRNQYFGGSLLVYATADDSSKSLKSTSWASFPSSSDTTLDWQRSATQNPGTASGNWSAGDILWIRVKFMINGTGTPDFAAMGKIRLCWKTKQ